jgi:hypothetical protein
MTTELKSHAFPVDKKSAMILSAYAGSIVAHPILFSGILFS